MIMREQAENELKLKQIISRMDLTSKCKPFGIRYTDEELVDIRYSGI